VELPTSHANETERIQVEAGYFLLGGIQAQETRPLGDKTASESPMQLTIATVGVAIGGGNETMLLRGEEWFVALADEFPEPVSPQRK